MGYSPWGLRRVTHDLVTEQQATTTNQHSLEQREGVHLSLSPVSGSGWSSPPAVLCSHLPFLLGQGQGSLRASQVVLAVKNPPANAGDVGDAASIPGLGRSPGGGHGNPFQYSCLENPHRQRSLAGYSPWCGRVGHD